MMEEKINKNEYRSVVCVLLTLMFASTLMLTVCVLILAGNVRNLKQITENELSYVRTMESDVKDISDAVDSIKYRVNNIAEDVNLIEFRDNLKSTNR